MKHRQVRDKKRYPDTPAAVERRRLKELERLDARYADDPDAEICRICGARRSAKGIATHMRQEHGTWLYVCECGEGFSSERRYENHLDTSNETHEAARVRRIRWAFVDSIVDLPYEEFVRELLRTSPSRERVLAGHDESKAIHQGPPSSAFDA